MPQIPAKYRAAVYVVATALLAFSFVSGWISPDQVEAWVDQAIRAAGIIASVLAVLNVQPD